MSAEKQIKTPEVSFSLSGDRLTLRDEAGGGEVLVELEGEPSLTQATTSWFEVPMDGAVSFEVKSIRVPHNTFVWLRERGGTAYGALTEQQTTVDGEGVFAEISGAMKVIAYIENGPVRGYTQKTPAAEASYLEFDGPTRVVLGARSVHEKPTATMVVPDDPQPLMEAVSHLGSSIKEWSAERSWPTLRGHPPAIVYGDELDIPDALSVPDTGVSISAPESIADILRVAPLAYYLGATIVPGRRAELRICGHAEPLGAGRDLERTVDQLLAQSLVLDSLVRIDGYFSLPRYEYEALAADLPFYPPELSDEPVDRQLLEYLEVSYETLEPYVPRWSAEATLRPSVTDAGALPYLLNMLSRIRVTEDARPQATAAAEPFARFSTNPLAQPDITWLPEPARTAALAYERRRPERGTILIVDDAEPAQQVFKKTNWQSYEIDGNIPLPEYRRSVTREELTTLLEEGPLYVHYGGEVTSEGFGCDDGVLPFEAIPANTVGGLSFQWSDPSLEALRELANVAVVTCLTETNLTPAVATAFGKYLVLGFPVNQSAGFVGIGDQTSFLGESSLSLVDHANGTLPDVFDVESDGSGSYTVSFCCRLTRRDDLGAVGWANPENSRDTYQLNGSNVPTDATFSVSDLRKLAAGDHLLRFDGPVPDEIPLESVIHASREDWLHDDAPQHTQNEHSSRR